jgi:hypothetical protein
VPILFGLLCLTLIVSAQAFHFSRDWFAVGRVLEDSMELRKETSYALALGRWLELEAERTDALEELWEDFLFSVRKLGLASVRLTLAGRVRVWESAEAGAKPWTCSHDFNVDGGMRLEFGGDAAMREKVFYHVSELAAESWFKAVKQWKATQQVPVRFSGEDRSFPLPLDSRKIPPVVALRSDLD